MSLFIDTDYILHGWWHFPPIPESIYRSDIWNLVPEESRSNCHLRLLYHVLSVKVFHFILFFFLFSFWDVAPSLSDLAVLYLIHGETGALHRHWSFADSMIDWSAKLIEVVVKDWILSWLQCPTFLGDVGKYSRKKENGVE